MLELTEKQLALLKETFNSLASENGDRILVVNDYWKTIEGMGIILEEESVMVVSSILDSKYQLGAESLMQAIRDKEFNKAYWEVLQRERHK